MTEDTRFPVGFLWGAATSAYQIEGSPLADGAGANIWHRFSHTPGSTTGGETGDMACDHYKLWADDVELIKELGLGAYRFSIAWCRIFPEGKRSVNPAGLAFYDRLIDALCEAGIEPLVTLYHWDLPAALDDLGGWLNPEINRWFADYATEVFHAYDDRVKLWTTLNEPWVVTDAGYLHGTHAPGHRSLTETPIASHNLLRSHAAAVQAYRAVGKHQIGLVVNLEPKYPASDSAEDLAATERADVYMNRQYLDPVFLGSYPAALAEMYGEAWPQHDPADMKLIQEPIDFLGVNYYKRGLTRHDDSARLTKASEAPVPGAFYTAMGWEVFPEGLTQTLLWVKERYGDIPIYITENGAALDDPPVTSDGRLEDPLRIRYYRDHLLAARRAMAQGVNLRGYFAWSLMDNYEWSAGYSKRFGIVHVDRATQKRTAKASAQYYRNVIQSNGAVLKEPLGLSEKP
jgi:beta-glucosidase